jgi:outer membrane protein assembly factor BamB
MLRVSIRKLLLCVSVLLLCHATRDIVAQDSSHWLVSLELLEHAKLELLWQRQLPIQKTESLEQLFIVGDRVYALSDRNRLVSLDSESGELIFGRTVAPAGFPVAGLDLYDNELMSVIGNKLVRLDMNSAKEIESRSFEFGIVCPAARNSSYFYVSGIDRRLHVLHAKNKVQVFEVAAENDSMITSIVADEFFVTFGTEAGNVICIAADQPRKLWQFDATDTIAGPIVRDGSSLFFASKDTNVYRIDMTGPAQVTFAWKHQLPGILENAPRVTKDVVYQHVPGQGLTAVDKHSGRFMWSVPKGIELLAEAATRAYVITGNRTLTVMDNKKAKKLYWVNFADVSIYAANTTGTKIYIADKPGRIACLQPVEH